MLNAKLPKGVYFKHGAFYRVLKRKWVRLGTTLDDVARELPNTPSRVPQERAEILAFILSRFASVRQNAKTRGIQFALVRADIEPMLKAANWRCAVTGTRFSSEAINGKRPFAPSIDRADSTGGYTKGNCRVVCVAANLAMNVWGDGVLKKMLRQSNSLDRALDLNMNDQ